MAQQAQESNLGNEVTTFSVSELTDAITKIKNAGDDYNAAYNQLVSYFENELQDAVQGDTLNEFKSCFDNRKAALNNVNTFIDTMVGVLNSKTVAGADLRDGLAATMQAHNN